MKLDRNLLLRIRQGDDRAFRLFFDAYVLKTYNYIHGYLKDVADSEDVCQNVFIKIWEKRASIDPEKSIDGFVSTITYRMVIDRLRHNATLKGQKNISDIPHETLVSAMNSEHALEENQLASLYGKALALLPPKRREIFLLSRHEGKSNREIAEILGISVKTVENQMTSALAMLRSFLDTYDVGAFLALLFFLGDR